MEVNNNIKEPEEQGKGLGHFFLLFALFIIGFVAIAKTILWLFE